jgi:hypothetical protein
VVHRGLDFGLGHRRPDPRRAGLGWKPPPPPFRR